MQGSILWRRSPPHSSLELANDRAATVVTSLGFDLKPPIQKFRHKPAKPANPARNARILVVDGDRASSSLMCARLSAENYDVESVLSAQGAIDAHTRFPADLVITSLRMEPVDGLSLLMELKRRSPQVSVIILTAHGTIPEAVRATQCGAFGFLVKPIKKEELLSQVRRAVAASSFMEGKGDWREHIVSRSRLMEDRLSQANRAARSEAPLLLTGQSGTGKELFARAIHAASARREMPFIAVPCKTILEEPGGAESFGPDTGLQPFAAARGGTLLLSEIGDLPSQLQAKLANWMRESESMVLGEPRALNAGVRLICTTSHDLKKALDMGRFHHDLYRLISVLPIEVPPLGRRREDIPLLVSQFLQQATEGTGLTRIYSPKAVELLVTTDWPGNVRQLFEFVAKNVALSQDQVMTEKFVQHALGHDSTHVPSFDEAREEFTRNYLIKNLQSTRGNVSKSARLAKRNRANFYKLLSRYRVSSGDFKSSARRSK